MTKFLVLYRSAISANELMSNITPEQSKAGMDMWGKWMQSCGDAIVDIGAPLGESKTAASGGALKSDGYVTGYSILQAGSLDDALKLVQEHPHLQTPGDASVEVLEFLEMPGME